MIFKLLAFSVFLAINIHAESPVPVVVELFTSEGCSSCPPADQLLAELETKQPVANVDLIVLSEHVDYWNSAGWKDPFSSSAFTARQQAYASRFNIGDIYTPQAVIDGYVPLVGSHRQEVLKAIANSAKTHKPSLDITIERHGDNIVVTTPVDEQNNIWLAITQARAVSHVLHGENAGRTLEHVGVVRVLTKIEHGQATVSIDSAWGSDLKLVAFAQNPKSGKISRVVQKQI